MQSLKKAFEKTTLVKVFELSASLELLPWHSFSSDDTSNCEKFSQRMKEWRDLKKLTGILLAKEFTYA